MTHREAAKKAWKTDKAVANEGEIKLGALLRIADSMDSMCKSRVDLEANRDLYKRWYKEEQVETASLRRTITGLRGYITRLKKELPK